MANKAMWDFMDKAEGKKPGSSYAGLQKEKVRQGYKPDKLTALQKKKLKKMSTGEKVYSSHEDHMDAMHKQLGIGKYRNQ